MEDVQLERNELDDYLHGALYLVRSSSVVW
jgi:hypothetical protein